VMGSRPAMRRTSELAPRLYLLSNVQEKEESITQ
jgi:hypothetical protein